MARIYVWILLITAGLLEVGWAIGLKFSDGFSRPVPAIVYACMFLSVGLLGVAMREIPVGTVYAIWTGIGTVGTVAVGIVLCDESRDPYRLGFIGLIVVGLFGLGYVEFTARAST